MAERRTIGQILVGFGRITEDELQKALQHQREIGGHIGEALLALELVSEEELEWGLASQFDLPYVFPDADSVDPEAAALVTPEWALAHLTVPIMKTSETVTVVVDSPIETQAVDELQRRSGFKIERALASPGKIRELVRQVYARTGASEEDPDARVPLDFEAFLAEAVERGGGRFGISVRAHHASGWYPSPGGVRRRPLTAGWDDELERLLAPPPSERLEGEGESDWLARFERGTANHPVEVRTITASAGREILFRSLAQSSPARERFPPPPAALVAEVGLLVRSGAARFALVADPPGLGREILPHLPALLLDGLGRAVYLTHDDGDVADAFTHRIPRAPDDRRVALQSLRAFHFDAVTADLEGPPTEWAGDVLNVASAAFISWGEEVDRAEAARIGLRWQLRVSGAGRDDLHWSLDSLSP